MDLNFPAQKLLVCTFPTKEESSKWLGLLFDSKIAILPHIQMFQNKRLKALNIFKICVQYRLGCG
jgi:hypothetical protein